MSLTSDMSQPTAPTCALGLTSADLSAWRDGVLTQAETARIGAHSASCPACQERLRGFEAIAATLQAQRVPAPDERLWQAVLAALSTRQRTTSDDPIAGEYHVPDDSGGRNPLPQSLTTPRNWRRRALETLAAVAAIALVVVGFGRLFQFVAQNRPSHAQAFALTWQQVTLPGGMGATLDASASLSVFARDGSIAWICQSGTEAAPGPLHVWRTTDAGTTWRSMEAPQLTRALGCQIQLDQMNSDVAVLDLKAYVRPNQNQTTSASFATFDGGMHWQDNPAILAMTEFATLNGATYAILPGGVGVNRLVVSRDGMKTWSVFDEVIHNKNLRTMKFWLHPVTGALLIEAFPVDGAIVSLWTTDASGRDWQQITIPLLGEPILNPTADGSWDMCSMLFAPESEQQPRVYTNRVTCGSTKAGGWTTRPGLSVASAVGGPTPDNCNGCIQVDANGQAYQLALATDGAVLALYSYRFTNLGLPTWSDIYRLPAGSTQWQKGGKLPEGAAFYAPRPGGGITWSMPATAPEGVDKLAGPVYVASYPGTDTQPLPTQVQQTPTPAGNITQGTPLAWQPIATPAGFQPRLTSSNILAVAPSDGRTAYACAQPNADPPAAPLRGWVTHDGGATWSSLALPEVSGWCSLVVDEVDPRDVLLGFSHNPPGNPPELYYRSSDGGATWHGIPGLDGSLVYQFASYRGAVYALRDATPGSLGDFAHVQVSADGMIGWRTIDDAFFSSDNTVAQFWLDPFNGELLASNIAGPVDGIPMSSATTAIFWRSSDGGAHWHDLGAPPIQSGGASNVFVQPPQANHAWAVCVANTSDAAVVLECSDDSDQRWRSMPALDTDSAARLPRYTAYTSDGAILAVVTTTLGNGTTTYNVYRLPAGAQRWQELGPTPEYSLLYAPAAGSDGMLWSVPAPGIIADEQGRVFAVAAP